MWKQLLTNTRIARIFIHYIKRTDTHMPSKNIGYHTRRISDNSMKVVGGSFGGSLDMETANRLVKSHFSVAVKPSGHAVFVDREGREVSLYFTVDAAQTDAGKQALAEWRKLRAQEAAANEALAAQQSEELDQLMAGLTHEEIVKRLRNA